MHLKFNFLIIYTLIINYYNITYNLLYFLLLRYLSTIQRQHESLVIAFTYLYNILRGCQHNICFLSDPRATSPVQKL